MDGSRDIATFVAKYQNWQVDCLTVAMTIVLDGQDPKNRPGFKEKVTLAGRPKRHHGLDG